MNTCNSIIETKPNFSHFPYLFPESLFIQIRSHRLSAMYKTQRSFTIYLALDD